MILVCACCNFLLNFFAHYAYVNRGIDRFQTPLNVFHIDFVLLYLTRNVVNLTIRYRTYVNVLRVFRVLYTFVCVYLSRVVVAAVTQF